MRLGGGGGCLTGGPQCRVSNSRNVACPLAKMLSYRMFMLNLRNALCRDSFSGQCRMSISRNGRVAMSILGVKDHGVGMEWSPCPMN